LIDVAIVACRARAHRHFESRFVVREPDSGPMLETRTNCER
jgi:hypothetical protein